MLEHISWPIQAQLLTSDVLLADAPTTDTVSTAAQADSLRFSDDGLYLGSGKQVKVCASIVSVGTEVLKILGKGRRAARVLAVFSRSFYVQCDHDVFCIGVASLGQGPLHVLLDWDHDLLPWQISSGLTVHLDNKAVPWLQSSLTTSGDLTASKRTALYGGKVSSCELLPDSLRINRLMLELTQPPNQHGFSWILGSADWQNEQASLSCASDGYGTIDRSLYMQCVEALQCLHDWLQTSLNSDEQASLEESGSSSNYQSGNTDLHGVDNTVPSTKLIDLLGAGPGLTPAGDDLLAGVMLALHRSNRACLAALLWHVLEAHLLVRTNVISAAHLRLAAQGQCSETMQHLLEAVFGAPNSGESEFASQAVVADVQAQANKIGASSGWDTLAGMSLVLRAMA